jgi:hypothetical protein
LSETRQAPFSGLFCQYRPIRPICPKPAAAAPPRAAAKKAKALEPEKWPAALPAGWLQRTRIPG